MRAVVFDLDGTLIDSAPDIQEALNRTLEDEGHASLDLERVISFIGEGLPKLVERAMTLHKIDLAHHARLTRAVLLHYGAAPTRLTKLYPGVPAALTALREAGMGLGLCTNKPEAATHKLLRDLALDSFFDAVVGGDTLPRRKPDPAPFELCLTRLAADQALFVGDSEVDAETASRAGVDFALFSRGYRKTAPSKIPHRYLFDTFSSLPELVGGHFKT